MIKVNNSPDPRCLITGEHIQNLLVFSTKLNKITPINMSDQCAINARWNAVKRPHGQAAYVTLHC